MKHNLNINRWMMKIFAGACAFSMIAPAAVSSIYAAWQGWEYSDDAWHYYENGMPVAGCWKWIDGECFRFDWYGNLVTGLYYEDGKLYDLSEEGMTTNSWKQLYNGRWAYFNAKGASSPGWHKIGNNWFWFDEQCFMHEPGFGYIDGKTYYFNHDGIMKTGWLKNGSTWYYFRSNGAMAVNSWQKIGGTWYYFNGDGTMATGWKIIGDKQYYFMPGGEMVTGMQYIGGQPYFFNSDGAWVPSVGGSVSIPTKPSFTLPEVSGPDYNTSTSLEWNAYLDKINSFLSDPRWMDGAWYDGFHGPTFFESPALGCVAYTLDFAWYVFDRVVNPMEAEYYSPSEIQSGDILRLNSPVHSVVVLQRDGDTLYTAEGNVNGAVRVSKDAYAIENGQLVSRHSPISFDYGIHLFEPGIDMMR